MSKERVYTTTGFTNPAKDGIKRNFTIAAVLTEQEVYDTEQSVNQTKVGKKEVTTITREPIQFTEYTLAIGIAIVSPQDQKIATNTAGVTIATGKARKIKSAHLVLTANKKYFTKGVINNILEREAEILSKNPDKYVHAKPVQAAEAIAADN